MVKGFSKAILMGNLTRDPETRATTTGQSVTSFSLAVNRSYKNREGRMVDEVGYFECEAWGAMGETIAKWCHRGSGLLVSGALRQDTWEDKETGKKRSNIRVRVEDFNFVGGGRDEGSSSPYGGGSSYGGGSYGGNDDGARSSAPAAKPANVGEDVLPDEIEVNNNEEIDLGEMPF